MVESKTYIINFGDLNLQKSEVMSVLGPDSEDSTGYVSDLVDELLEEAGNITELKAQFKVFENVEFVKDSHSVAINDLSFGIEKIVYGQLKKSVAIAVFLCTAGPEIGLRSKSCMQERDFLKGYIYDVIGSEIVEAAVDFMQSDLKAIMNEPGLSITNRYSPGYCGWNVADQHKLFRLMPENFCGIKLTGSALMDPVKSVSGFIGIGSEVKWNPYSCRMCRQEDCVYRRIREKRLEQNAL
jgi:hypothetical protein